VEKGAPEPDLESGETKRDSLIPTPGDIEEEKDTTILDKEVDDEKIVVDEEKDKTALDTGEEIHERKDTSK
jgi:hypothetical protein